MNPLINQAQCVKPGDIRLCQVEDQQKNLSMQCDTLGAAIEHLEQRLSPVLRCTGPEKATNSGAPPREMLVSVAEEARNRADQIQIMHARLASILERLELP